MIIWLTTNFRVVSLYELINSIGTESSGGDAPLCCLTFDDGLQDHYFNVFSVLKKYKIPGHFFVSTYPFLEGKATDIHLTHALQAYMGELGFAAKLQTLYRETKIDIDIYGPPLCQIYSKWASPLLANLKFSLKMLADNKRRLILERLFLENIGDSKEFANELYLTVDQMLEMKKMGMIFGNHGHAHRHLGELNKWEQLEDLRKSNIYLSELLEAPFDLVSYPFGSYDFITLNICKEMGFRAGLTINRGDNPQGTELLEMRRVDIREIYEFILEKRKI